MGFSSLLGLEYFDPSEEVIKSVPTEDADFPEVDYFANPTNLFKAIEAKKWASVKHFLLTGHWHGSFSADPTPPADQVCTWVTKYEPTEEGDERGLWTHLPIHAAIIYGAPDAVLKLLVKTCPPTLRCANHHRMLPLHLAFKHGCSDSAIGLFLDLFPEALNVRDFQGRSPVDCAMEGPRAQLGKIIQKIFQENQTEWQKRKSKMEARQKKQKNMIDEARESLRNHAEEASHLKVAVDLIKWREDQTKKVLLTVVSELKDINCWYKHQEKIVAKETIVEDLATKLASLQSVADELVAEAQRHTESNPETAQIDPKHVLFGKLAKIAGSSDSEWEECSATTASTHSSTCDAKIMMNNNVIFTPKRTQEFESAEESCSISPIKKQMSIDSSQSKKDARSARIVARIPLTRPRSSRKAKESTKPDRTTQNELSGKAKSSSNSSNASKMLSSKRGTDANPEQPDVAEGTKQNQQNTSPPKSNSSRIVARIPLMKYAPKSQRHDDEEKSKSSRTEIKSRRESLGSRLVAVIPLKRPGTNNSTVICEEPLSASPAEQGPRSVKKDTENVSPNHNSSTRPVLFKENLIEPMMPSPKDCDISVHSEQAESNETEEGAKQTMQPGDESDDSKKAYTSEAEELVERTSNSLLSPKDRDISVHSEQAESNETEEGAKQTTQPGDESDDSKKAYTSEAEELVERTSNSLFCISDVNSFRFNCFDTSLSGTSHLTGENFTSNADVTEIPEASNEGRLLDSLPSQESLPDLVSSLSAEALPILAPQSTEAEAPPASMPPSIKADDPLSLISPSIDSDDTSCPDLIDGNEEQISTESARSNEVDVINQRAKATLSPKEMTDVELPSLRSSKKVSKPKRKMSSLFLALKNATSRISSKSLKTKFRRKQPSNSMSAASMENSAEKMPCGTDTTSPRTSSMLNGPDKRETFLEAAQSTASEEKLQNSPVSVKRDEGKAANFSGKEGLISTSKEEPQSNNDPTEVSQNEDGEKELISTLTTSESKGDPLEQPANVVFSSAVAKKEADASAEDFTACTESRQGEEDFERSPSESVSIEMNDGECEVVADNVFDFSTNEASDIPQKNATVQKTKAVHDHRSSQKKSAFKVALKKASKKASRVTATKMPPLTPNTMSKEMFELAQMDPSRRPADEEQRKGILPDISARKNAFKSLGKERVPACE